MFQSALIGKIPRPRQNTAPAGMTWLANYAPSGATVDMTSVISGDYTDYLIVGSGAIGTIGGEIHLRTSTDNGSSFTSSASSYDYTIVVLRADVGIARKGTSTTSIYMASDGLLDGIGQGFDTRIWLYRPLDSSQRTRISFLTTYVDEGGGGVFISCVGAGMRNAAEANDAIQVFGAGNITGKFAIYGVNGA